MKKILLTLLVAFSFMFMTTNVVNAEEVTGGQTEQQTLKELDSSALDVIDSTYHINKKESELDVVDYEQLRSLQNTIKEEYIQKIEDAGYDISKINNYSILFNVGFKIIDNVEEWVDIHKIKIELVNNDTTIAEKEIEVSYSNTSNYNQQDFQYVSEKSSKIKLNKFQGVDTIWHLFEVGELDTSPDVLKNYDFSSLINDKTITVKPVICGWGKTPELDIWGPRISLYLYKNDILYATKDINFLFGYGTTSDNGAPIVMDKRDETTDIYKEMSKELEKQGLTNIIGCYELTYLGSNNGNTTFSFNIGTQYNGRGVKILHRKNDGTFETFETKVENGKATITVSEFSPFMIALTDDDPVATKLSNNAQTSSMNIIAYITLALSSLIGIAYIIRKKKIA